MKTVENKANESNGHLSSTCWRSISGVLLQNQCWICGEVFIRGKMRKVFTVAQLLDYYKLCRQRYIADCLTGKTCFSQYSIDIFPNNLANLNICWNRLCYLEFNDVKIDADLADIDLGKWISSLACCNSEICAEYLSSIVGDTPPYDPKSQSNLCPPGCGCDNPWQFVSK